MHNFFKLLFALFLLQNSISVYSKQVTIALVTDGPAYSSFLSESQVRSEIRTLLGDEFEVKFVTPKASQGDWTINGITNVMSRLYKDNTTDIIVTLGAISSNEVNKFKSFPKPTVAAAIINPAAQKFALINNKSGRTNFSYIADLKNSGGEILFFKEFVEKKRFGILIEPILIDSWPELKQVIASAEKEFGITMSQIPLTKDLQELKSRIPEGTEAVMVGLLSQYSESDVKELAQFLKALKLPSYSFLGEKGVEQGFMVTEGQINQDRFQISRRIAINIQRILLGQNARNLPVNMDFSSRVVFNEGTGYAIGFAPEWQQVINAKVINQGQATNRQSFTISQAIAHALENNFSLAANEINVDLAAKDVNLARTNLYPQVSLGAGYSQIGTKQVVTGVNPERRVDAQLNLAQKIYSESLWANYDISKYLLENQDLVYQAAVLDIAQQAAASYLTLLSAKADESIRVSNLELTRKNLELSQTQLRIGTSGKSDVLRWKSQLATDRRNLFLSTANKQNAELELARVINLPQGVLVDASKPNVASLLSILTDVRFQNYVTNQIQWNAFQEFYKLEAVANAPELKSFDSQLDVNEREIISNNRGYYIPDIDLTAQAGRNFSQSGLGAIDNPNEDSWTVGVQATLPIDLSGARSATIERKKLEKKQLQLNRQSTQQQIVSNTGKALFNIGSSYPSIQLSREAAAAASESLELVQDAYAKGSVSIADLLDAQNNALAASLSAANAEYEFLQDYILLMRSAGDFKPIINGKYSANWFDRLHKFFRQKGIEVYPRKESINDSE